MPDNAIDPGTVKLEPTPLFLMFFGFRPWRFRTKVPAIIDFRTGKASLRSVWVYADKY